MRIWISLAIAVASLVALALGCEPYVADSAYFCGPNRLCPPGQACDDPTWTCDDPNAIRRFECPEGTQVSEPNDQLADAVDLGTLTCGQPQVSGRAECIPDDSDIDAFLFTLAEACPRNNTASVAISFPAGFAPLLLEVVDAGGAVVATGEVCTRDTVTNGLEQICAEVPLTPQTYSIRIQPRIGEGTDCDGDCQYNWYELDLLLPP